jgi:hypothetical protein
MNNPNKVRIAPVMETAAAGAKGWVSRGPTQDTHDLLDERLKETLGDFWRVLRTRPSATVGKPSKDVEYVPNSMYSYYRVKTRTLRDIFQMTRYCGLVLIKAPPFCNSISFFNHDP